ncbi:MAG: hypothetical protein AAFV19_15990 [Pseudomonadota bacterium]
MDKHTERKALLIALALNAVWINASEIFRYFVFVMPMMREAFGMVPGIAPMDLPVFLLWGVWDTILICAVTGFGWLVFDRFGAGVRVALFAGTAVWMSVFGILWLGLWNMGLATGAILMVALPLAWVEMVVAALIVRWVRGRAGQGAARSLSTSA